MDEAKSLIVEPEKLAKIMATVMTPAMQRWLGAGDEWLCDATENPDACESHERHLHLLWSQTVRGVDYSLRWDPTWGQLVVMELGFVVWFGFPHTGQLTEDDLLTACRELDNAIRDAWRTGN